MVKREIHPNYYGEALVSCACGNKFTVGSTKEKLLVEICSTCHPFFSDQDKIIDTAGRVEKFKRRQSRKRK